MAGKLSHLDESTGKAKMVNVGGKAVTGRRAVAGAEVHVSGELCEILAQNRLQKGDAFAVARTAGILAAKKTHHLIPLCHSLPLDEIRVEITLNREKSLVYVEASASNSGKTGVEMEALTAASVAALTIYDMCKAVDKTITVQNLGLHFKSGGKSGEFRNPKLTPAGG